MKYTLIALLMFLVCSGSDKKPSAESSIAENDPKYSVHSVDWEPCSTALKPLAEQADKFNKGRKDGLQLQITCMYGGGPGRRLLPKKIVHLTATEIKQLHALRKASHGAFEAKRLYEDHLIVVHKIKKLEIGQPCYFFVDIILDDDFITIDPNPFDPTCRAD